MHALSKPDELYPTLFSMSSLATLGCATCLLSTPRPAVHIVPNDGEKRKCPRMGPYPEGVQVMSWRGCMQLFPCEFRFGLLSEAVRRVNRFSGIWLALLFWPNLLLLWKNSVRIASPGSSGSPAGLRKAPILVSNRNAAGQIPAAVKQSETGRPFLRKSTVRVHGPSCPASEKLFRKSFIPNPERVKQ